VSSNKAASEMTDDELVKEGYSAAQISDVRRRAFEEKSTLGMLIASGAMIGLRFGGPLGAIIGGAVGIGIDRIRKQALIF